MSPEQLNELGVAIRLVAGLLALMALWQFGLKPTFIAEFRQFVISQRRKLFLFMAEGNISPDDPAYLHLRRTMNGLLRRAEQLTVCRLLLSRYVLRGYLLDYAREVEETFAQVSDPAVRAKLREFDNALSYAIKKHFGYTAFTAARLYNLFRYFRPWRGQRYQSETATYFTPGMVRTVEAETELVEMRPPMRRQKLDPVCA
jgi:hypothetical protein